MEEERERVKVRVVKPVPETRVKPTPKLKPVPIEPPEEEEEEEGWGEEAVEERLAAEEEMGKAYGREMVAIGIGLTFLLLFFGIAFHVPWLTALGVGVAGVSAYVAWKSR